MVPGSRMRMNNWVASIFNLILYNVIRALNIHTTSRINRIDRVEKHNEYSIQ